MTAQSTIWFNSWCGNGFPYVYIIFVDYDSLALQQKVQKNISSSDMNFHRCEVIYYASRSQFEMSFRQ